MTASNFIKDTRPRLPSSFRKTKLPTRKRTSVHPRHLTSKHRFSSTKSNEHLPTAYTGRQRHHGEDCVPSTYIFIGRSRNPPFVFSSSGPLTLTNMIWLKTGQVDEEYYLMENDMARHSRPEGRIWEVAWRQYKRKVHLGREEGEGKRFVDLSSAD
ncbi:uncharacterized protein IL334_005513 [Kwoniella shivajii]|uniref:Uncharacterized protein n=1 Tax=Kwoniella shivajii TaxID=564305 RepID=A0ABZ1D3X3_9TREE|nr:hypothetical protein IL334_005513 [Kwoniella shivajii]